MAIIPHDKCMSAAAAVCRRMASERGVTPAADVLMLAAMEIEAQDAEKFDTTVVEDRKALIEWVGYRMGDLMTALGDAFREGVSMDKMQGKIREFGEYILRDAAEGRHLRRQERRK